MIILQQHRYKVKVVPSEYNHVTGGLNYSEQATQKYKYQSNALLIRKSL